MNQKKAVKGDANKVLPGWMASYADMFTVLMAFFVLLFAMSIVDEELFQQFLISFNPDRAETFMGQGGEFMTEMGMGLFPMGTPPPPEGPGGDELAGGLGGVESPGDVVGTMENTFMTYMAIHHPGDNGNDGTAGQPTLPEGIHLIEGEEGDNFMRVVWTPVDDEGMLFNSGQARLTDGAMETLNFLGPILREFVYDGYTIIVEGHTDDVPINTTAFPSNWSLSGARASTVVEYLTSNWDVPPYAIFGIGRGEYFPIADNATPEGRAQNRRVEIVVFNSDEVSIGSVMGGGGMGGTWAIPRD